MGKWDGWRLVEEFPNYQINSDGEIRNRFDHYVLEEKQNKHTGVYFYALNKNGMTHNRSYQPLLYKAWPELIEAWKPIPGFPNYLIDRDGLVMGNIRWKELPMRKDKASYHLKRNGRSVVFRLEDFDWTVFDNYEELEWYKRSCEIERWRSVPGWNSHEVSDRGRIRHKKHRLINKASSYSWLEPGVLYARFKRVDGTYEYLNYSDLMAEVWPQFAEREAA